MSDEINLHIGAEPRLGWVEVGAISVDRAYQRDLKPRLVKKILKDFSWAKFGCVSLAAHADGKYAVVDGQHRLAAAKLHPGVRAVPASIFTPDDAGDEAAVFLGVNIDRTAVTPVERYWAGLNAGDATTLAIRDLLAKVGCSVTPAGGSIKPGQTNAVSALGRAIDSYGEKAVLAALVTLRRAWPKDPTALAGTLISALARLYKSNGAISVDRMVEQLQAFRREMLTADAEGRRKLAGGSAETALARTLVDIYNKGLSKNFISFGVRG